MNDPRKWKRRTGENRSRTWIELLLSVLVLGCIAECSYGQERLPPLESEEIYRRLEEQEREIQWLRSQVLANQAAVSPGASPPQAPLAESVPAQFASAHANDLNSILHRLEALEEEAKRSKESQSEKKASDDWTDVSTEKWTVKLGGHVQLDWAHWVNADDPPIPARDYFEFRRLRLLADGTGYGVFDFRLQLDIEPESGDGVATPVVDVKDAYLTMHEIALLQRVRIGNFFVPFSLEQVTNDTNNIFMERSIPTQGIFAADREVGIAMYGVNDTKDVTWTFGAFFDSISESLKERIDDNQGYRLSSRFTWTPYYDEPSNGRYVIHTGIGFLFTDDQDDLVRFRARPQIHEGPFLIDSGNVPATTYSTGNLELAMVWGPLSIQSELFLSSVDRIAADRATLFGGYIYGSYFLTGEHRIYERYGQHGAQFGRNVPFTNVFFVPGCFGWGAWELKVRTSYLDLNELDSGRYNDLTAGINWYWTDRIRVMFDWIHPWTTEDTPYGERSSDVAITRFDFNW